MTDTVVETILSPWPLAEETLAVMPERAYLFTDREGLEALEAAPDVIVESRILSEFDHLLDCLKRGYESDRALIDGWLAEKWDIVFPRGGQPVPGLDPLPDPADDPDAWVWEAEAEAVQGVPVPDEAGMARAQLDATQSFARWAPKVALPESVPPLEETAEAALVRFNEAHDTQDDIPADGAR